jgi:hypothetical protein
MMVNDVNAAAVAVEFPACTSVVVAEVVVLSSRFHTRALHAALETDYESCS